MTNRTFGYPDVAQALLPTLASDPVSRPPTRMVGRTPPSAAGPLAGLPRAAWSCFRERKAGPGGPARTRGSAPPTLPESRFGEKYVESNGARRLSNVD